jgi:leucyl aminopeptidase
MIDFLVPALSAPAALPLTILSPATLPVWLAAATPAEQAWAREAGFSAGRDQLLLLPGPAGLAGALAGIGDAPDGPPGGPWAFGFLPFALPEGSTWRLEGLDGERLGDAVLGFALGGYRYAQYRVPRRPPARLAVPDLPAAAAAVAAAEATFLARDLVNHPANLLGPAELAEEVKRLAEAFGARFRLSEGAGLESAYPTVAAVGRGSARPPRVAELRWSGAGEDAPLVALCGKGVCFDTGGYDLKPSSAMLRMKKDMGGAAIAMGLARMIMAARLPVRLRLLVGAVENSVGANAMRPLDVIRTRKGLSVEIGNTDAEGRLVLCDLLADADADQPAVLMDFATLTGAARVALGPDLPAMFASHDGLAQALLRAGDAAHDPCWRLPLWAGYAGWIDSKVADMNNVSARPMAGSIVAALYLQRFVSPTTEWAHFDVYAWNDADRPGRPEGGEAQAMRGCFEMLRTRFAD